MNDREKLSDVVVTAELAVAIEMLGRRLQEEFGSDFSFTVMGRGEMVAASNRVHGIILPNPRSNAETGLSVVMDKARERPDGVGR